MVRGITFNEQLTQSKDFAHFQNTFLNKTNGITKGCDITYDTEKIYIASGYFIICGRFVELAGIEEIATETVQNGTLFCHLVFEINLSKINTIEDFKQGYFKILTSESEYLSTIQEDLDANGMIYQMSFATFKKSNTGIINFDNKTKYLTISRIWDEISIQNQLLKNEFETFYNIQKDNYIELYEDDKERYLNMYEEDKEKYLTTYEELKANLQESTSSDIQALKDDIIANQSEVITYCENVKSNVNTEQLKAIEYIQQKSIEVLSLIEELQAQNFLSIQEFEKYKAKANAFTDDNKLYSYNFSVENGILNFNYEEVIQDE